MKDFNEQFTVSLVQKKYKHNTGYNLLPGLVYL